MGMSFDLGTVDTAPGIPAGPFAWAASGGSVGAKAGGVGPAAGGTGEMPGASAGTGLAIGGGPGRAGGPGTARGKHGGNDGARGSRCCVGSARPIIVAPPKADGIGAAGCDGGAEGIAAERPGARMFRV
jgi:hypothetical protein